MVSKYLGMFLFCRNPDKDPNAWSLVWLYDDNSIRDIYDDQYLLSEFPNGVIRGPVDMAVVAAGLPVWQAK